MQWCMQCPESLTSANAVVLQRLARDRSGVDLELVPGVYEASVELQQPRPASSRPDTIAVTAPLVRSTNVVPFAITPRSSPSARSAADAIA